MKTDAGGVPRLSAGRAPLLGLLLLGACASAPVDEVPQVRPLDGPVDARTYWPLRSAVFLYRSGDALQAYRWTAEAGGGPSKMGRKSGPRDIMRPDQGE